MKVLQIDFPHQGPFGQEMATMMTEFAGTINDEPGMIWKIWTENEKEKRAGGVYLFDTEVNAQKYLDMHIARLTEMGYSDFRGVIFDANERLSAINKGPVHS